MCLGIIETGHHAGWRGDMQLAVVLRIGLQVDSVRDGDADIELRTQFQINGRLRIMEGNSFARGC